MPIINNKNLQDYEEATEVKVYKVIRKCPLLNCDGMMEYNGRKHLIFPPEYGHSCTEDTCSNEQYFNIIYPKIIYEEI